MPQIQNFNPPAKMLIKQFVVAGDNLVMIDTEAKVVCAIPLVPPHKKKWEIVCQENAKIATSPNGNYIAMTQDNDITLIDEKKAPEIQFIFKGHTDAILDIILSDKVIVSTSADKTIRVWDIDKNVCVKTITNDEPHTCLTWKKNGGNDYFYSAVHDAFFEWSVSSPPETPYKCIYGMSNIIDLGITQITKMIDAGNCIIYVGDGVRGKTLNLCFMGVNTTDHMANTTSDLVDIQLNDEVLYFVSNKRLFCADVNRLTKPNSLMVYPISMPKMVQSFIVHGSKIFFNDGKGLFNNQKHHDALKHMGKIDKTDDDKKQQLPFKAMNIRCDKHTLKSFNRTEQPDGTIIFNVNLQFVYKAETKDSLHMHESLKNICKQ